MRPKQILFLKDVAWLTLLSFGGPQVHLAMMLRAFVKKRQYITEQELLELNALTQVLPGPSSTETLIGVAYKVGGMKLAIMTFVLWILPSAAGMCLVAINFNALDQKATFENILLYVQPIAVGSVAFAAFSFARSILKTSVSVWLAAGSLIVTLILKNAYVFPISILIGGILSSALEAPVEETVLRVSLFSNINRNKVLYFLGILLLFAALGAVINQTSPFSLPIRLFENFYRNGIMIFGGGQVLVPLMFTEFVKMKHYLSASQFLAGYSLQQALPGPTFSFTSFLGAITMKNLGEDVWKQVIGSVVATVGINLPGVILILFFVPFWNDLKKFSRIRSSLSGVNAVSVGFLIAAFIFLLQPLGFHLVPISIMVLTFLILKFTKIRIPFLIMIGILLGLLLK